MPWVRLDDQFTEHPKVVAAGPLAGWLYVCGLTYCARQLTDGFIPRAQLRRLLPTGGVDRLAARLVTVGLWEPADDGYRVHDFLNYNASREQTLALRKQKADAGRRGGWRKAGRVLATRQPVANTPVPIPQPCSAPTEHLPEEETSVAVLTTPPAAAERAGAPPTIKALEPRYSADFELWWAWYPRRREKIAAYRAYRKTLEAGATDTELLLAARHCAAHVEEQGTEERFIPLPATFLGPSRKWLDFRDGVPCEVTRTPRNGVHKPNAFDLIDREVARLKETRDDE